MLQQSIKRKSLRRQYDRFIEQMPPRKQVPAELRSECLAWIGELRRILAETCLHWLEPDLIILDEFQRFKHLMAGGDEDATEAAALAEHLFNFQDESTAARVLLLSATPYKMFTTSQEEEHDDHYEDFRLTLNFLISDPNRRDEFERVLVRYRDELLHVADRGTDRLIEVKQQLEHLLRNVMVRTERLAIDADRDGMLVQKDMAGVELQQSDVRQYLALQNLASLLEHGDMLEYWKSAPYLMNFMEHYDVKRKLEEAIEVQTNSSLAKAFRGSRRWLAQPRNDRAVQPRRTLATRDCVRLPRIRLAGMLGSCSGSRPQCPTIKAMELTQSQTLQSFTKRLVFSSWKVVPKAIASVLSYEAERQMMLQYHSAPTSDSDSREKIARLLQFRIREGKPSAMTALGILYPCRTLADRIDPRDMLKKPECGKG